MHLTYLDDGAEPSATSKNGANPSDDEDETSAASDDGASDGRSVVNIIK